MPIYIDKANLVIPKAIIEQKYLGGKAQFELDYKFDGTKHNRQDNELYVLVSMNSNDFDESKLHGKGLHFSKMDGKEYSSDYAVLSRYGGTYWECEWLSVAGEFMWHKNANSKAIEVAKDRANWTLDKVRNGDGEYFESVF